jgi:hypothetical protein
MESLGLIGHDLHSFKLLTRRLVLRFSRLTRAK